MKRLNFTIILSLLVVTQLLAQEKYTTDYEVQYKVSYSIDSTHLDQKQDETVYLYTGSKFGVFMNYRMANAEEIQKKFKKQARAGSFTFSSDRETNFNKIFYENLQNGKVKTLDDIGHHYYLYTEPKIPNWQIGDSTKSIDSYKVQKATTHFAGRDYVAWFTTEVPIHDGPYLFSGLPGLIVELYDTRNDYHFILQSLQKLDKPKIWTIPQAKKVSKAKFKKLKAKAAKNVPSDRIEMGNVTVEFKGNDNVKSGNGLSPAKIRRMNRERMARKNNPIELK